MKKIDKPLLITVFFLIIISLFMIYSASFIWAEYKFNNPFKYVINQGIFSLIGLIILYIISKIDYHLYYKNASKILIICLILLILVLIPGIGIIRNGSRSWFGIGNFSIQPSEFAKIGLIIFTSKYLANSNKFLKDYKKGIIPILSILFLIFALIMLEPDFGTGMIIVTTIIAILFIAGVDMKFFIGLFILGIIGIVFLIIIALCPLNYFE